MKKSVKKLLPFLAATLFAGTSLHAAAPAFELRDGDQVAFIGDTLMEREQAYGYIELALTLQFPDRNVTFRNLGWSADTPAGDSREGLSLLQAGNEPPGEGLRQLKHQIEMAKPTVVFLGYGMANSFAGEPGLAKFTADLNALIDSIQQIAGSTPVRFVVLSPVHHENLGAPLPDPAKHNQQLALYTKALKQIADQRGFPFISLFDGLQKFEKKGKPALTDNGIHLNAYGYEVAAEIIENGLGLKPVALTGGPKAAQLESLRQSILEKDELFFDRSRPQNMAYLFGFRKHEQGKNAAEIPEFDPLIKTAEERIAKLRKLDPAVSLPQMKVIKDEQPANDAKPSTVESMQFEVEPGFEISLFAENPMLAKPIQMNFDPQGRLWVVSSSVYPQIQPGQEANDKVLMLEDTNGDGVADKSTVFADGLMVPTAVVPGDGGVYVGQSTELLFFKDNKGTGKADEKRIVLSGFGTEDTHHIIHTLRWGNDGQLYFNQSIYIRTHAETPNGVVRLKSGGIMSLRTPTMQMEVFLRGWVNSWGHIFDKYGQSFVTDGAGFMGISYGLPGSMHFTYAGARRTLQSISPGNYPKFASLEIVRSQQFPDDWQGDLITCDFRAHRVVHFKTTEQGAGYVTQELPDLVRTANVTFRPIDVKLGPDGALYIADWSNPIIQHGEVDFRDPRRDHEHGRIWRVTAKGRPLVPKPNLVKATNKELLDDLLSPNGFTHDKANRVLTERGKAILADLKKWTSAQTTEQGKLEALWMFQAVDVVEPALLKQVIAAQDGKIRAAGTRVVSHWISRLPDASDLLARLVQDDFPRVRVEAMRALTLIPTARSADLVLSALNKPMDPFLDYAVWHSINDLSGPWLDAIRDGSWKIEGHEKQLEFGLKAIEPSQASTVLALLLKQKPLAKDGSGPWIELIGGAGSAGELRSLFDHIVSGGFDNPAAVRALNALAQAARLRGVKPGGDLASLARLVDAGDENVRVAAVQLAGAWKLGQLGTTLLKLAGGDAASTPALSRAAFETLRETGGPGVVQGLRALTAPEKSGAIRQQSAIDLMSLDRANSLVQIVNVIAATTDESEALALWRSLLAVKGAGPVLARGLASAKLPDSVTHTGLRVAREGGRSEPDLVATLARSENAATAGVELTTAQLQEIAAQAMKQGDPARGELLYRRQDMACMGCHSIGGVGGKVGPDLTSVGASAQPDYLVESVLYPNRKIKEGFHSTLIETKDDQEYSGILVRENEQELILRNVANQEISVPKNNIKKRTNGMSLMPAGLVDGLPKEDRLDLYRFLAELGKPGPYDAAKGNVARSWRILPGTHRAEQFGVDKVVAGAYKDPEWKPMFSHVDGRLLHDEIADAGKVAVHVGLVSIFASTQFEVARAGAVNFRLPDKINATTWVDGQPVKGGSQIAASLGAGTHTIVIRLDAQDVPAFLRLESADVSFLAN